MKYKNYLTPLFVLFFLFGNTLAATTLADAKAAATEQQKQLDAAIKDFNKQFKTFNEVTKGAVDFITENSTKLDAAIKKVKAKIPQIKRALINIEKAEYGTLAQNKFTSTKNVTTEFKDQLIAGTITESGVGNSRQYGIPLIADTTLAKIFPEISGHLQITYNDGTPTTIFEISDKNFVFSQEI
jgi:hypothetical protein